MFTTPCFIRKNTPELRKALEDFGYNKNSPRYTDDCNIIFAYQYPVKGFDNPSYVIADTFDIPFDKGSLIRGKFIDCGVNEDLFLALAALRDDTDAKQWFTDGKLWEKTEAELPSRYMQMHGHKATADELIEHFTR